MFVVVVVPTANSCYFTGGQSLVQNVCLGPYKVNHFTRVYNLLPRIIAILKHSFSNWLRSLHEGSNMQTRPTRLVVAYESKEVH